MHESERFIRRVAVATLAIFLAILAIAALMQATDSDDTPLRVRAEAAGPPVVAELVAPRQTTPTTAATTTTSPPPTTTTAPPTTVAAAATEPPAPAPAGACGGWQDQIAAAFPAEQVATACRIMLCESGGNPGARNPSGASGLFQLMPVHAHRFEARGWSYDPDVFNGARNIVVAADLWRDSGWGPWSCR